MPEGTLTRRSAPLELETLLDEEEEPGGCIL